MEQELRDRDELAEGEVAFFLMENDLTLAPIPVRTAPEVNAAKKGKENWF
jgi:hypothetical protein